MVESNHVEKVCPQCRSEIAFPEKKIKRKNKEVLNRKKLANVRVIQRNLVYVTNISLNIAKADLLKKEEYFGKYGKIKKIVVNKNNVYSGPQGRSVSAYVTYFREQDAASAIADVDKKVLDSRVLRASFGTTKYCSYFLRSVRCPNPDCMYLHELGTEDDSFTKEDMSQGKHLLTSARRVSKYHPNFMNGRDFSNEDMEVTGNTLTPSLNKSVDQLPRVKVKKHQRSRSQGGESDHEETYYQEWQERFIDDSSGDSIVPEKKVKRKIKEETHDVLFHWPKSFQAWFKLLLLDSQATPPLKMLNNFRKIWTIEEELTSQSRFAFARESDEEVNAVFQHMNNDMNFSKPIPEQMYVPHPQYNTTSWSMKNIMAANTPHTRSWDQPSPQKGNWNFDRSNNYSGLIQNKWQQNFRDTPPGL
jgi:hypothetical protein